MKKPLRETTINRLFAESAKKHADLPALHAKIGGAWNTYLYRDVAELVRRFSNGIRALGVNKGDRVALLSENRPEWAIADLGVIAAGAVTVPIFPTLPSAQVEHVLSDSGAAAIIVSDAKQLLKAQASLGRCANLRLFITMDESTGKGAVMPFDAVLKEGDANPPQDESFEQRRDSVQPSDLASLVYTSGTTGDPKGAMLTHNNFAAAVLGAAAELPIIVPGEQFLSYLPLCHVYERVVYYLAITHGGNTYYAESLFKVQENMAETRPTFVQTVPRLLEVIHEKVLDSVAKLPPGKQTAFNAALRIGHEVSIRKNTRRMVGPILAAKYLLANKLVLTPIRKKLGGRLRFFVSGGAPLRREPAEFFNAIGTPLLQGYGLTETTAAACCNRAWRAKVGTVGLPFPGAALKIAPDGEILIKGPIVMQGYWNQPEATAEVLEPDGWFHTGDIGEIDKDGHLKITDRKKDIIVLANGKNVAPQPIEARLRRASMVSDIVLLGDHSGTISAIVVPDFNALGQWARHKGIIFADNAALAANPLARKEVKRSIDALSGELAEFEKVRKIGLVDHPFTIEDGELTPTLKIKRKVIKERYGALVE
jgi:long-chain acyl-CoA synthetase